MDFGPSFSSADEWAVRLSYHLVFEEWGGRGGAGAAVPKSKH